LTSSIVTTKFNGKTHSEKTYIATIHCPGSPTLTGVLAVVSIDENNNCKVMIKNCAPYEVTIKRNNLLGLVEIKEDKLIPLTDDTAAEICAVIKDNIPKTPRIKLTRDEIA
jgi:hypothetical protein